MDSLLSKVKSKLRNHCTNIYTQGKFMKVIPMALRSDASKSLIEFMDDVGISDYLIMDGASNFTGQHTEFLRKQGKCILGFIQPNKDERTRIMWQNER